MKCEKCGNDYNSQYYFATPTICRDCFSRMSQEEQDNLRSRIIHYDKESKFLVRAGFGRRFAATLIDLVIYASISFMLLLKTGYIKAIQDMWTQLAENPSDQEAASALTKELFDVHKSSLILAQLIPILYFSLELLIAASIGKLILGLVIGNDDQTKAEFGSLLTRYLIKNLSSFVIIVGIFTSVTFLHSTLPFLINIALLIGFFFILNHKRQAFHDMFSKTAIYKKEDIIKTEISF